jgi:hypothetical protein
VSTTSTKEILDRLKAANDAFSLLYPGDTPGRQPVHTVYGGAQIFKADTSQKLGATALRTMKEYAPTASAFAKAIRLEGTSKYHSLIYARIFEKLKREPVEDFRIDFEDGYATGPTRRKMATPSSPRKKSFAG